MAVWEYDQQLLMQILVEVVKGIEQHHSYVYGDEQYRTHDMVRTS